MDNIAVYDVFYSREGKEIKEETFGSYEEVRKRFSARKDIVLQDIKRKSFIAHKPTKRDVFLLMQLIGTNLKQEQNSTQCLSLIVQEMPNDQSFKVILHKIVADVMETGVQLSEAFGKYPSYFGPDVISLLRAVEIAGTSEYSTAFLRASELLEKSYKMQQKFIKDISYPVTLLVLGTLLVIFLTQFIVPSIFEADLFKNAKDFQSGMTFKILSFLVKFVPTMIISFLAFIVGLFVWFKVSRKTMERFIKKLPFVRDVVFNKEFSLSFYLITIFIRSGIRLEEALELVANSAKMIIVRIEFEEALGLLRKGFDKDFVEAFKSLEGLEKAILKNSSAENILIFITHIYDRFQEKYDSAVAKLPKITAYTILVYCIFTLVLAATAIFAPLDEVLRNLSKGL